MAKKTTKKKLAKRATPRKTVAAAPKRASASKAQIATQDPVTAALQRRRLAMLSR
jgi:hypothetical protein